MIYLKKTFLLMLEGILALVFPQYCYHCGISLSNSFMILCRECESELPATGFEQDPNNRVYQAFWGRAKVEFATSSFHFRSGETLQYLIHLLKYRNHSEVGEYLGLLAGRQLMKSELVCEVDYIIPVPLHPKRYRARGYNQSEEIAQGIALAMKLPIVSDVLIRPAYNVSQTTKNHYERWENVDGIFHVMNGHSLENKRVLLVDDIITTGATIEACCHALNKIEGVKIVVVGIGYTSY